MNVIELFRKACLITICTTLLTSVKAQTTPPSLDKKVRVPLKEVNIITLADMITAQTGFILSFNAQKITTQKQLLLRQPSYSIHQLLTMIKEATGSEYIIYQDHVIFRRINSNRVTPHTAAPPLVNKQIAERSAVPLPHAGARTAGQPGSSKGLKTTMPSGRSSNKSNDIHRSSIAGHTNKATGIKAATMPAGATTVSATAVAGLLIPGTPKAITKTGIVANLIPANTATIARESITADTITATTSAVLMKAIAGNTKTAGNSLSYIAPLRVTLPAISPTSPVLLQVSPPVKREKKQLIYEKPGLFKPFVQAGFAADEALYANLQAKAGITLVYGTASWSTNFSVSGFRYGAGLSYPLNNGWLIELEATTGKLFKETPIQTISDTTSTKPPLYVSSRLQRISLFAQKSIAPHLSVYAGPVFNHLKSTYQLNTWPLSLATLREIALTPEKDYAAIRSPYILHRSPAEETEDIRTWIGFQIGISYRL